MNALNKLIQERFADITQGASADVYPLTLAEKRLISNQLKLHAALNSHAVGTDIIDEIICNILENRK